MPSFTQIVLAAAAFGSLAVATPLRQRGAKTFSFNQVSNGMVVKSGANSLASVYRKYNKEVPQELAAAAAANNGEGINTPAANDEEYLTPVVIGGQTLKLDFDTGSSDLYVFHIFESHDELQLTYLKMGFLH